jgi:cell division protein FtsB
MAKVSTAKFMLPNIVNQVQQILNQKDEELNVAREKCVKLEKNNKMLQKEKNVLEDEMAKLQHEKMLLKKKLQMKESESNGTLIMLNKIIKHNYFWKCLPLLIVTPIMISMCLRK